MFAGAVRDHERREPVRTGLHHLGGMRPQEIAVAVPQGRGIQDRPVRQMAPRRESDQSGLAAPRWSGSRATTAAPLPNRKTPPAKAKETSASAPGPAGVGGPRQTPNRSEVVCGHVDIYPTLLDLAGVTVPGQPPVDGVSLVPLLDGTMTARPKPLGFMLWNGKGDGEFEAADFVADTQGVWIDSQYKLHVFGRPMSTANSP